MMHEFNHESGLFEPRRTLYGKETSLVRPQWMSGAGFFGAGGDPFWKKTILLVRGDGANGSTAITDIAGGHSFGVGGNAKISNTRQRFGTGAMELDGSGDYWVCSNGSDFFFGTQDFTIEGWFQSDTVSGLHLLCGCANGTATNNNFSFMALQNDGAIQLSCFGGGNTLFAAASKTGIVAGQTHHFAFQRKGDTVQAWLDGQAGAVGSMAAGFNLNSPTSALFWIGQIDSSTIYPWDGMIDELRITKGVARYTGNFAVPTTAYPNA